MEYEKIELLHEYFQLDYKIQSKERKKEYVKRDFFAQNLYGYIKYDDPKGIFQKGFNVESKVINYLDYLAVVERQIIILKRKNYHFKAYLATLDYNLYLSLKRRYKTRVFDLEEIQTLGSDQEIINELLEIEEAISYEFKKEFELFNEMKLQFGSLSNETLEDSFDAMLEVLGV